MPGFTLPFLVSNTMETVADFDAAHIKGLIAWYDASDSSTITSAYNNLAQTASGTSGSTTIVTDLDASSIIRVGMKIRVKGTDIYTVSAISTVTITTVETLVATYLADVVAVLGVSQLNDKSPSGWHLTQGTAAAQPIYNPTGINGLPTITYDGSNDVLSKTTLSSPTPGATLFTVHQTLTATPTNGSGIFANAAALDPSSYEVRYNLTPRLIMAGLNSAGTGLGTNLIEPATGISLLPAIASMTLMGRKFISHFNGAPVSDGNYTNNWELFPNTTAIRLGRNRGSIFLNASISEIILYRDALSKGDRVAITRALGKKWGITVS